MNVTITQVDHDNASGGVEVYVEDRCIGIIGRGESVSTQVPDTDRCHVRAVCGVYRKEMVVGGDADILVKWVLNPPDMVMERKRK